MNFNEVILNAKINKINTQLSQKANQSDLDLINTNPTKRFTTGDITATGKRSKSARVSFIADDGFLEDYTVLKPIFESEGVPCCSAIVTNYLTDIRYMTITQILELQSIGWEIASHTVSHLSLSAMTEAQTENELLNSKTILENAGCKVSCVVYPFGNFNNTTKRIARKYYRSAIRFGSTGWDNPIPYDTFGILRISLGSYFDTANGTYPITNTFDDYYKKMVDKAVADNSWLVIALHSGATDATQLAYLTQTIQYIKSLGVPIQTPSTVLNETGNLIDAEGYSVDNMIMNYFRVGSDGKLYASNVAEFANGTPSSRTSKAGDRLYNNSPSNGILGWVCIVAGSPGTWKPFGQIAKIGTTAQRPIVGLVDVGFIYLDTTLSTNGKPIWWNGTSWVDSTGTIV